MYLTEMHQHHPGGCILNEALGEDDFSLNLKKKNFNVNWLVTYGKTLPLCGKEKIVQLKTKGK